MNYDLDFRYRRALQPDALCTIATATQAVVDAMQDARNAGVDAARDPATILLARHVGRIALGNPADATYEEDLPSAGLPSAMRPTCRARKICPCAGSASPGSTN